MVSADYVEIAVPEVGVLEAKTRFSALVEGVEAGGEAVVITRHGRPVARLSGLAPPAVVPRKLSGDEIVERLDRLHDLISREYPGINELTQEDLKRMARE